MAKLSSMSTGRIILLTIIILIVLGAITGQIVRIFYASQGKLTPAEEALLNNNKTD